MAYVETQSIGLWADNPHLTQATYNEYTQQPLDLQGEKIKLYTENTKLYLFAKISKRLQENSSLYEIHYFRVVVF